MSGRKFLLSALAVTTLSAAPISTVYQQRCANCHGSDGDKHVMNRSDPIKGLPVDEIEKALNEYATGSRPTLPVVKTMKKYFLDTTSPEQVHELAQYIHTL